MSKFSFRTANFWGVIIGIISILASIILFILSNKQREPVYSIVKEPTLIYDKENASSNFSLVSNDSILIDNNVYVSTIALWNNGELEIKKDDVRKNIKLSVINGKILDYKIIRLSHPEVSEFELDKVDSDLIVNWDHFDPKFGFEFQVIYSGTFETELKMSGFVLGSDVKKVKTSKMSIFLKIIFMVSIIINWYLAIKMSRKYNVNLWLKRIIITLTSALTVLFIYALMTEYYLPF